MNGEEDMLSTKQMPCHQENGPVKIRRLVFKSQPKPLSAKKILMKKQKFTGLRDSIRPLRKNNWCTFCSSRKCTQKFPISGKLEWPIVAEIINRTCLIVFPSFTMSFCGYYILFGFFNLYADY